MSPVGNALRGVPKDYINPRNALARVLYSHYESQSLFGFGSVGLSLDKEKLMFCKIRTECKSSGYSNNYTLTDSEKTLMMMIPKTINAMPMMAGVSRNCLKKNIPTNDIPIMPNPDHIA